MYTYVYINRQHIKPPYISIKCYICIHILYIYTYYTHTYTTYMYSILYSMWQMLQIYLMYSILPLGRQCCPVIRRRWVLGVTDWLFSPSCTKLLGKKMVSVIPCETVWLTKVECAAVSAGLRFMFKLYTLTDGRKSLIKGISIKCP